MHSALSTTHKPSSKAQRRQAAVEVAARCSDVLKREFGASEVIVFGSLRGDAPWHDESDLDIAVRGLSQDRLLLAQRQLETVIPKWLPFDLVAVERADERVRDRILRITPIPNNMYLALKLRLEDELNAIEKTTETLNELLSQAEVIPEIALVPAAAGYIEDFYSGCERLAQRVAVALDNGLPDSRNWHEQLLKQMASSGGYDRPPLWPSSLLKKLDAYRSFRHRVRHLYSVDLDKSRVLELASQVPAVFTEVQQATETFNGWLVEQAN